LTCADDIGADIKQGKSGVVWDVIHYGVTSANDAIRH
jgi:hypothetical protein